MEIMKGKSFERSGTIEREHIDQSARAVPVAISSENPVQDWWGINVLLHDKKAIDLSRGADNGFPLLWRHGDEMLGRVKEITLGKDKVLRGKAYFGNSQIANEKWQDVQDGVLTDISVGGSFLEEPERQEDGSYITRRWAVNEVSFVPVPADPSCGINRNKTHSSESAASTNHETGVGIMPDQNENGGGDAALEPGDVNVADFKMARKHIKAAGRQEGAKLERTRIADIRNVFALHITRGQEYQDLMNECIDQGIGVERAKNLLLEMIGGENPEPIGSDFVQREDTGSLDSVTLGHIRRKAGTKAITAGQDSMDKFMEGAENALLAKGGVERDQVKLKEMRKNEFFPMGMSELAREYLRLSGANIGGIHDKRTLIGDAITRAGVISHSSSDFANLLENVASKSLLIGYEEAPENWQSWCRIGNLPDFRTSSRPNMSTFGDLDIVYENGEYKYGSFSDLKETLTLATYGKLFNISRQALINDDLNAFTRVPMSMGRAASRKIGDLAYGVLTSNPTLNQDSTALFDASHSNLVAAGSGAAPSVTTIEAGMTAMALQTDPTGNVLNIQPAHLIVPVALKGTAMTLMAAQYDPAGTAGTLTPNTVQGAMDVIADARLDADDPLQWYLAANANMHDTVEVAFLDGNQTPFLESQDGWKQDGVEYKVRIDAVAGAMDYRGLYQNDGN
jgi:hypothetical protein